MRKERLLIDFIIKDHMETRNPLIIDFNGSAPRTKMKIPLFQSPTQGMRFLCRQLVYIPFIFILLLCTTTYKLEQLG